MIVQRNWELQHVPMRDIKHFPLRDVIWEIQKIFLWEMFLWGLLGEMCKNLPLRDVILKDVIWEIQEYGFERCWVERKHWYRWRDTTWVVFLWQVHHIFSSNKTQVFVWKLLDGKRILWNAIKANPQSKFYMSNVKMEFLIIDTQSGLYNYTLKVNSQSKLSK